MEITRRCTNESKEMRAKTGMLPRREQVGETYRGAG